MKTKVIEVKSPPLMKMPAILQGIRDKNAAQSWGEKNGHAVVYFIARKQRVYAERLLVRVATNVREQASADLVSMAEGALPTGDGVL